MKSLPMLIGSLLVNLAMNVGAYATDGPDASKPAPLESIAGQLQLTATQKSQIDLLWRAKQHTIETLVRELNFDNNEPVKATALGAMDEGRVTEIANREGVTLAHLLIVEERLKVQIYATVLTPDQRAKADRLAKQNRTELVWVH